MTLPKPRLRRIDRARTKEKPWKFNLREALLGLPEVPMVLAERARREAEAAGGVEKAPPTSAPAGPPSTLMETERVAPNPPPPQAPPPEPKWWEEKLGWQSCEMPPPSYYDDGVRYETFHEYDPLEQALNEED